MNMRSRFDSPSPSPSPVGYWNQNQGQKYIPQGINWANVPFAPHECPDGRWGQNEAGDHYLTLPDKSYHYFNADGSYYWSDGKPGNSHARGKNIYVSPRSERFITPADEHLGEGEYFIGRNWRTQVENVYWEHKDGLVERSFRKNVDLERQSLPWDYVSVSETYRVVVVDANGQRIARRQRYTSVPGQDMSRWRGPSQSQSPTVVGSQNGYGNAGTLRKEKSKEGRCCVCM